MAAQCGLDHSRGTAGAALDTDSVDRAVQLAGSAFHANMRIDKISQPALHFKHGMRTDIHTNAAADAGGWVILQGSSLVGIEHGNSDQPTKKRTMLSRTPAPNIHAMMGIYA